MEEINYGDRVCHVNPAVNQGQEMDVLSTEDDKALCSLSDDSEEWFALSELRITKKSEGDFI
ncbi:hypothetical protein [Tellurirhabdus bombi]|uniref:hypothetical protein n=1 Tax=Tellurirhabdus bombi TaxID=2907205 RepID=UPI001F456C25|nr:hypothetical protein [Tellurirhabdus bombi]